MTFRKSQLLAATVFVGLYAAQPSPLSAHCDAMDGPVVKAGVNALESGELAAALIWIDAPAEAELREAWAKVEPVRKLGGDARLLADRYFLETLVRLHRAGEGAPYTGLKPAGRDIGPAVAAADRAVETGELGPLSDLVAGTFERGLNQRFQRVRDTREFPHSDVAAGRRFVKAYVQFVHYVERAYDIEADTQSQPARSGAAQPEHEHN